MKRREHSRSLDALFYESVTKLSFPNIHSLGDWHSVRLYQHGRLPGPGRVDSFTE